MKVELSLHATKLRNVAGALGGTSDPFAVVTQMAMEGSGSPIVVGRTETIQNTLDPQWTKTFVLDYELGKTCNVNVGIYDEVKKKDKPMGSALFEIGDVLGAKGNVKAKKLKRGGTVFAMVNKYVEKGTFRLKLRGIQLTNTEGFMRKSDPFYEVCRMREGVSGVTWDNMYRSNVVKDNLSPKWDAGVMDLASLCDGDLNRPIKIRVYDFEKSGKHVLMGEFETTVQGLMNAQTSEGTGDVRSLNTSKAFQLTLNRSAKSKGLIVVTQADVTRVETAPPTEQMGALHLGGSGASAPPPPSAPAYPPPPQQSEYQQPPAYAPSYGGGGGAFVPGAAVGAAAAYGGAASHGGGGGSYVPGGGGGSYVPGGGGGAYVAGGGAYAPSRTGPSFIDYLSGGCELNVSFAIDFTGSNGNPHQPGTLHYLHHPPGRNDYENAMDAIGSILAKYDSDQMFAVWGFGAKYEGVVRHCFQMGPAPEVRGVHGVLEAYRHTFSTGLIMSKPTVFEEVIRNAALHARQAQDMARQRGQQKYSILLLLTDGVVSDVAATARALEEASTAPLSIVIVGIGQENFSTMQYLDDFDHKTRDILQFVEFNRHRHSKQSLTKATLDEIPRQLVDYFQSQGIAPMPPIRRSDSTIFAEEEDEDEIDLSLEFGDSNNEQDIRVSSGGYYGRDAF